LTDSWPAYVSESSITKKAKGEQQNKQFSVSLTAGLHVKLRTEKFQETVKTTTNTNKLVENHNAGILAKH